MTVRAIEIGRLAWLRLLAAVLLALVAAGLASRPMPPAAQTPSTGGDAALYRAIDARVGAGESYYTAAATEQRTRGYPLRPFVTVRLPTRSWLFGAVGPTAALGLLWLLAASTLTATVRRLWMIAPTRVLRAAATIMALLSVLPLLNPVVALWPELWAGLLVAWSLAIRRDDRWRASVALGLGAILFREHALAYPAAMAALATLERRRGEAVAWALAAAAGVAAIACHAQAVHAVVRAGDMASQGWVRFGGWAFDLSAARAATPLMGVPAWAAAILAPLALFGWAATADGYARRVTLTLVAWLVPFCVIGRPENSYWGMLLAPLWLVGLPLAIPALAELARGWRAGGVARAPAFTSGS